MCFQPFRPMKVSTQRVLYRFSGTVSTRFGHRVRLTVCCFSTAGMLRRLGQLPRVAGGRDWVPSTGAPLGFGARSGVAAPPTTVNERGASPLSSILSQLAVIPHLEEFEDFGIVERISPRADGCGQFLVRS